MSASNDAAVETDGLAGPPALAEAADLAAAAPNLTKAATLDPTNFLTWTHRNWKDVPVDQIRFPSDQTPLKTKAYYG